MISPKKEKKRFYAVVINSRFSCKNRKVDDTNNWLFFIDWHFLRYFSEFPLCFDIFRKYNCEPGENLTQETFLIMLTACYQTSLLSVFHNFSLSLSFILYIFLYWFGPVVCLFFLSFMTFSTYNSSPWVNVRS